MYGVVEPRTAFRYSSIIRVGYLTAAIAAHRRGQVVTSLLRRPKTPELLRKVRVYRTGVSFSHGIMRQYTRVARFSDRLQVLRGAIQDAEALLISLRRIPTPRNGLCDGRVFHGHCGGATLGSSARSACGRVEGGR